MVEAKRVDPACRPIHVPTKMIIDTIDLVVFDAAWTVIHPQPRFTTTYAELGKKHGVELSEAEIGERFANHFATICWDNTNELEQLTIWKGTIASVFRELESTTSLFDQLWQHYSEPAAWNVYLDVAPTFNALEELGIPFVIGSNFDGRLQSICAGHDLFQRCAAILWSADMGVSKPQPEFYRTIAKKMAVEPHHILMVGDNWQNDFDGPRTAGWSSAWLNRNNNALPTTDTISIESLPQLLSLI